MNRTKGSTLIELPLVRECKWRAFTLVELLVVVAIIALLTAIFIPVMQRASEKAKRTVCGTNLKGIDTAFLQYSTDYGDKYPIGYKHEEDPDEFGEWTKCDPDEDDITPEDCWALMVHLEYLPTKMLLCPSVGGNAALDEWALIGIGGTYDGNRDKAVQEYIHYAYQDVDAARSDDFRKNRGNYLAGPNVAGNWPFFADRGHIRSDGTYTGRGSGNHPGTPAMQNVVGGAHGVEVAYTAMADDPDLPRNYDYDEENQCMVGYSDGKLFDNIYINSDQYPYGDYDDDDHRDDTYLLSSSANDPDY